MEKIGMVKETVFFVGGHPLEGMYEFKYMGRVLDKSYDDYTAL